MLNTIQLPALRTPLPIDSRCLLSEADALGRWRQTFRIQPMRFAAALHFEDDGSLRIDDANNGCLRVSPWPEVAIARVDEHPCSAADISWAECIVVPTTLEEILPNRKDRIQAPGLPDPRFLWLEDWGLEVDNAAAIKAFNQSLPGNFLDEVFAWKFPSGNLAVLACMAMTGYREILQTHPQLAWMLAQILWRHQLATRMPNLWRLTGLKWAVRNLLNLPASRSTFRIFRRLHFRSLMVEDCPAFLAKLKTILGDEAARTCLLNFEAPVTPHLISLIHRTPRPSLAILRWIHRNDQFGDFPPGLDIDLCYSILAAIAQVQPEQLDPQRLSRIESPFTLIRLYQEKGPNRFAHLKIDDASVTFPFSADKQQVVPLESKEALVEAGTEFCNCLASESIYPYLQEMVAGTKLLFIFKQEQEKALVALEKHGDAEHWTLVQQLGPKNQPISAALSRAIQDWCQQNGICF